MSDNSHGAQVLQYLLDLLSAYPESSTSSSPPKHGINDIHIQLIVRIFCELDGATLVRCRRVCKLWKHCIDGVDDLWKGVCKSEYPLSSAIAKSKSGDGCSWFHIYRNLTMWKSVTRFEKKMEMIYEFKRHITSQAFEVNSSVVPLKDEKELIMYDLITKTYDPEPMLGKNVIQIASNNKVTVFLLTTKLLLQRSVAELSFVSEAVFKADKFVLTDDFLYFCNKRIVYKCDLENPYLLLRKIHTCDCDIKQLQASNNVVYIFTACGRIVTINSPQDVVSRPVECPPKWVDHIKHVSGLDDKHYVCYSKSFFMVESGESYHYYHDYEVISALFYYGETILIGNRNGEILSYRISRHDRCRDDVVVFEYLAHLPEGRFAISLDVCERVSGPALVVSTYNEVYLLEINFNNSELKPESEPQPSSLEPTPFEDSEAKTFHRNKALMFERFKQLATRLNE